MRVRYRGLGLYYPEPSLEPGEHEALRCESKRQSGLVGYPGRLVLTDRRILFLPANTGVFKALGTAGGVPLVGAVLGAVERSDVGRDLVLPLWSVSSVSAIGRWKMEIAAGNAKYEFLIMRHDIANARERDQVVATMSASIRGT